MPFLRPNLTTIRNSIYSDVVAETGQPAVRRSILAALSWAWAGVIDGLYMYMDWIAKQSVPFTSTGVYLQAWGALVGISREAASIASGSVTVTWTASADFPPGTVLSRSDGTTYTTVTDATGSSGTQSVAIVATTAGSSSNCPVGTVLNIVSPIIGIASATVSGTLAGGADDELDPALRTRILQRYSRPPQGGNVNDYLGWISLTPGVTREWVNPLGMGAGTVVVYSMFDVVNATNGGFPFGTGGTATAETRDPTHATLDLLNVANTIQPLKPVTALLYSVAPVAAPINFTITGMTPNTPTIRAGISAALSDLLLQVGTPLPATIATSAFNAAIASVPGVVSFTLVNPSGPVSSTIGNLPTLGAVTIS